MNAPKHNAFKTAEECAKWLDSISHIEGSFSTSNAAAWIRQLVAALPPSSPVADSPTKVSGETSDGYHTFNELYAYRKAYNALLFNEWAALGRYGVHKSWQHSDGESCFGGGWFVVSAQTPVGQITNHYETADWGLFQVPERERADVWDGHTPAIALERLLALATFDAPERIKGVSYDALQGIAPSPSAGAAKDKE